MHWNYFNKDDNSSGITRYEKELFYNFKNIKSVDVRRIQKHKRNIFFDNFKSCDSDITHGTFHALAPLALTKKPDLFVLTVHDIIPRHYFSILKKIKHMWHLVEMGIDRADAIITDSEFSKKDIISSLHVNEEKIFVVPLGVSKIYSKKDKDISREKTGLKHKEKYVLINTSMYPWKNVHTLYNIIDRLSDIVFVKVGYNTSIKKKNVINLGWVPESKMPYLYSACDVFLHTSEYEGFGLPVLEAMACGCPVVSSNATSLPEVVGDAGILVNTYDVDEYCNHILEILNNAHTNNILSKKGLDASTKFTWENTTQKTMDVYQHVLENR